MSLSIGLHLTTHNLTTNPITVTHEVCRPDGRLVSWITIEGMAIFCNSPESAEEVASALRMACNTPIQYAPAALSNSATGATQEANE